MTGVGWVVTFCCTWVVGCVAGDPLVSRTEGSSGGLPSIAHLFVSYLERMKDSILLLPKSSEKVKRRVQRQLTDRPEYGRPSNGLPSICWRGDSPIFEWTTFPKFSKSRNEGQYEPDLKLNGRPRVEIDRFDFADVCPHGPVDARASNA